MTLPDKRLACWTTLTLWLGVVFVSACSTIRVPRVDYPLPNAVLAPIAAPSAIDQSAAFANLFCAVLKRENPDAGSWGSCADYIERSSFQDVDPGQLSNELRVLVVPGLMNMCAANAAEAFSQARKHVHDVHGLTVDYLPLPDKSSEQNGQTIAAFLKARYQADGKKFIVIGYSKGATDLQEGLAADGEARNAVAAMISVAGTIGGSRLVDLLPKRIKKWSGQLHLENCTFEMAALNSLNRGTRQQFLMEYPAPPVRTYSLISVSEDRNTSLVLKPTWDYLRAFDLREDSQVIAYEGIAPGSKYLGTARADHWAVAMPFEFSPDEKIRKLVDRNHFPRVALFEALVRYVIRDLGNPN